tara:strand:- start:4785 stop:6515 length:1731 start_codon:yes stop_codon:yes gene_type:complete
MAHGLLSPPQYLAFHNRTRAGTAKAEAARAATRARQRLKYIKDAHSSKRARRTGPVRQELDRLTFLLKPRPANDPAHAAKWERVRQQQLEWEAGAKARQDVQKARTERARLTRNAKKVARQQAAALKAAADDAAALTPAAQRADEEYMRGRETQQATRIARGRTAAGAAELKEILQNITILDGELRILNVRAGRLFQTWLVADNANKDAMGSKPYSQATINERQAYMHSPAQTAAKAEMKAVDQSIDMLRTQQNALYKLAKELGYQPARRSGRARVRTERAKERLPSPEDLKPTKFRDGNRVMVRGLDARHDGRIGVVAGKLISKTKRVPVQLDGDSTSTQIRPRNLQLQPVFRSDLEDYSVKELNDLRKEYNKDLLRHSDHRIPSFSRKSDLIRALDDIQWKIDHPYMPGTISAAYPKGVPRIHPLDWAKGQLSSGPHHLQADWLAENASRARDKANFKPLQPRVIPKPHKQIYTKQQLARFETVMDVIVKLKNKPEYAGTTQPVWNTLRRDLNASSKSPTIRHAQALLRILQMSGMSTAPYGFKPLPNLLPIQAGSSLKIPFALGDFSTAGLFP